VFRDAPPLREQRSTAQIEPVLDERRGGDRHQARWLSVIAVCHDDR
jgi:hypothetical protein